MAIEKTSAIIIRKRGFRETSLIMTFFTRDHGKLKGLLKGARADRFKFSSSLEPFSENNIVFYRKTKGEIHLISVCDQVNDFGNIRLSLEKINLAAYFCNLIELFLPLEDPQVKVYDLLKDSLQSIHAYVDLGFLKKLFEVKLLSLSGFKPHLDACISCSKVINSKCHFNLKLGGLVCSDCLVEDIEEVEVSQGAIASLIHLEKASWEDSLRLKLSKKVDDEISFITKEFLVYHAGIDFKFNEDLIKSEA